MKHGSLLGKFPEIAHQLHPTKNGGLLASELTIGSSRRVWWIDDFGYEWQDTVCNRTKGLTYRGAKEKELVIQLYGVTQ